MPKVILNQAPQVKSAEAAPKKTPALEVNYVLQIQHLVYRILDLLSKTSEADRAKVEGLKREYSESSKAAAVLQKRIGNAAPWFATLGFALTLVQLTIPNSTGQQLIKSLSKQLPSAGKSLYDSHLQARQMDEQSRSSRANTELNLQQSKQSSESGQKQEVQELLRAALRTLEEASRA